MSKATKRLLAYVIDAFVLSTIFSIITIWIPTSSKYEDALNKGNELIDNYTNDKIDEGEFFSDYFEVLHTISKEEAPKTLINIVLFIAYFGTFAYYYNGQTLGKKILNIKVVSNDGKKPGHLTFIGRALIANGILINIITLILLFVVKSNSYLYFIVSIDILGDLLMLISFILIAVTKNKKAIHDYIFKTQVIDA